MESTKLKIMLMFTGSDNDIMTTSELLEIVTMKKAGLHALLMDKEIFPNTPRTSQLPGSSENSPNRKYFGLRLKTPLERLSSADVIISVGTKFEANSLTPKILHQPVELDGNQMDSMHLMDIEEVVCGISENGRKGVALVQPTTRGQFPQYGAMSTLYPYCKGARHFYKTGGMAASAHCGTLVVAAEGQDGLVIDDYTESPSKAWKVAPGFPGNDLQQASFSYGPEIFRTPICTGGNLVDKAQPLPYEIEMSGFMTALQRRGAFVDTNRIGFVGVVTSNFENSQLSQGKNPDSMDILAQFWKYFLNSL